LSYRHERAGLRLGFYQRHTDYLVDIGHCPLLVSELNVLLEPLKQFLQNTIPLRGEGFVHLTATVGGVDLSWSPHRFRSQDLTPELWSEWAAFAHQHNIARITRAAKDLILQRHEPFVKFSPGTQITFPSAAFLQPSVEAEQAMVAQMLDWIQKSQLSKNAYMADLFCGLGTFSFPLRAVSSRLLSADCDGPSIQELKKQNNPTWKVEQRDLFTSPLSTEELNEFDLVVLDPPRAGAFDQIQELAQSNVSHLIMIACDVGTFARDAAFLAQSGWSVKEVKFLDQFPHTTHVEVMALLVK
jgi:23S rRNA (uracil1939-C5)-methyltransferase